MAIKRYYANADNTITNAFEANLTTRGTGSNMGQADILEVGSLYGYASATSAELIRFLIKFPITNISSSRTSGEIPASGSVSFYLKLYNAKHIGTTPRDFKLDIMGVSGSWEEGYGLDMEHYSDLTYDKIGSNWIRRTGSTSWSSAGGDYYTDASSSFSQTFELGTEDLEVDVTTLVEQWINTEGNVLGSKDNHGFGIKLSSSYEASSSSNENGALISFYTKKFFARSSEYFFSRPVLEARWNSSRKDNRGNFYISSSLAPGPENLNTLYMYNYIRGRLQDIKGDKTQLPVLKLYYSSGSVPEGSPRGFKNSSNATVTQLTANRVSKGIYSATFAATSSIVDSTYPYLVDVWHLGSTELHTGSAIDPKKHGFSEYNPNGKYVIAMPNLKKYYTTGQTERFRLYIRRKNWSPSVYSKAKSTPENLMIESASYQLTRMVDDKVIIPYNTGSDSATLLSYDVSGNYFDLDMNMLEPGYVYGLKYSFYEDSLSSYREQPYIFKIRVEKDES